MSSRTYQAQTMAQALAAVKRELGRDAVILQTRRRRQGGFLGIGGTAVWEITAAAAHQETPVPADTYVSERPAEGGVLDLDDASPALGGRVPLSLPEAQPGDGLIERRMDEIHSMVRSLLGRQTPAPDSEMPATLGQWRQRLLDQDVEPAIADDLIARLQMELTGQQLGDAAYVRDRLIEAVARAIRVDSGPAPRAAPARVVALVGPTGVGKTTTIAKLAANYKLRANRRVGLITIDTYRIAAVDQLRTYAEIIDVPLRAVLSAEELRQAVDAMRDLDVVLIDTAGRSQNDQLRLNQLRTFIAAAGADEVHMVISAASNPRVAKATLERFAPVGADRIILTKLDEAATFGMILNVASAMDGVFTHVTTGQDVPDDIAPADADTLARYVVGGRTDAQ